MNSKFPPRALLVLPGAFSEHGGVQAYNRLLIKAFSEIGAADILILNDRDEDIDLRYLAAGSSRPRAFARSRVRFAAAAIFAAIRSKPDLVVFGHVNFAPLARIVGLLRPRARTWFMVYGIDA